MKQPLVGTKAYWEWYKKEFTWAHVSSEDESFVEILREGEASYAQPLEEEKAKLEEEADTPERLSRFQKRAIRLAEKYDRHTRKSWTACRYDRCSKHRSEKEGSRWYPRGTKNKY